jgi:4-amino-4-deoxy-L-arabinose transferase-like glycosyltransferase
MRTHHQPVASSPHIFLIVIVAIYVVLGVLYATLTPTWQVPDEPAHYNYIRSLAEGRGLPVIEPGDYDQNYLSRLTTEKFPPELSIEPLEYADHHPPLYYLLATPVYLLFDGALLPLRLLSVLFGAALLVVAFGTVRAIFPARPELALMAAAFIAFIPQHVAMTAGVENDALAELIVGGALWALVIYVGGGRERPWPIGLLLAAALLTKPQAYVVLGVAAVAVVLRWRRERRTVGWAVGQLAWMFIPALLLSAPWFIRNGLIYGWSDPTGLARHDEVVAEQMRTSEFLALHGWTSYWKRALTFTFQSFWGQLGWMAVPLPTRVYQALALLSALLFAGFIIYLVQHRRRLPIPPLPHSSAPLLLVLSAFFTLSSYVWYNLTFVQHQGRYLFPALIPIGTAAALGLNTLADILPRRMRSWGLIAFFAGLAAFDVYCLFKSIPFLTN